MSCIKVTAMVIVTLVTLSLVAGLLLYFILDQPKNPVFSIESSAVKAYNLTYNNRLFTIINLGVRAHNPNSKSKYSFKFKGLSMEVRKGNRHVLAGDVIGSFHQGAKNDTLIAVEAVGLRVELKKKIVSELMDDVAKGEGRVNVFFSGILKRKATEFDLGVKCKNALLDFSGSMEKFQKVDCKVTVKSKSE